jgi:hypothetical protein
VLVLALVLVRVLALGLGLGLGEEEVAPRRFAEASNAPTSKPFSTSSGL